MSNWGQANMATLIPSNRTDQIKTKKCTIDRRHISLNLMPVSRLECKGRMENKTGNWQSCDQTEFEPKMVDYTCRQICLELFPLRCRLLSLILYLPWPCASRAHHEIMESVRILFWTPSKSWTEELFRCFFRCLVNLTRVLPPHSSATQTWIKLFLDNAKT